MKNIDGLSQYTDITRSRSLGSQSADLSVASGLRGQLSDRLSVYQEDQFQDNDGQQEGTRISGLGMRLTDQVLLRVSYEKLNQDNDVENVETNAVHAGVTYIDLNKVKASSDVDLRYDDRAVDFGQLNANNVLEYIYNDEVTLFSRAEFSWTDDIQSDNSSSAYNEYQLGLAFRPIKDDRFNFLAQYKRLDDKAPVGQMSGSNFFKRVDELYEIDAIMDVTPRLTLAESFARRDRRDIGTTELTVTSMYQWVNRINYELHPQFDLVLEYRLEGLHQTDETEMGGLIALDYLPVPFFRLSGGYSFRHYEDNFTTFNDVNTNGMFIRFSADMSAVTKENVLPALRFTTDFLEGVGGFFKKALPFLSD